MAHPKQPDLHEVITRDDRYAIEAYEFLCQALSYTRRSKGGAAKPVPESDDSIKHVSVHELLEGIRQFAIDQFGMMARVVFELWGVRSTGDFGNMVYTLIDAGVWRKSETDRIEDFAARFDFFKAFDEDFQLEIEGAI